MANLRWSAPARQVVTGKVALNHAAHEAWIELCVSTGIANFSFKPVAVHLHRLLVGLRRIISVRVELHHKWISPTRGAGAIHGWKPIQCKAGLLEVESFAA